MPPRYDTGYKTGGAPYSRVSAKKYLLNERPTTPSAGPNIAEIGKYRKLVRKVREDLEYCFMAAAKNIIRPAKADSPLRYCGGICTRL